MDTALKKLFGCPPPPAPNFEKLDFEKVFTVQKYTAPNFQSLKKVFFFFENFDLSKLPIFQVVVVNLFTF